MHIHRPKRTPNGIKRNTKIQKCGGIQNLWKKEQKQQETRHNQILKMTRATLKWKRKATPVPTTWGPTTPCSNKRHK